MPSTYCSRTLSHQPQSKASEASVISSQPASLKVPMQVAQISFTTMCARTLTKLLVWSGILRGCNTNGNEERGRLCRVAKIQNLDASKLFFWPEALHTKLLTRSGLWSQDVTSNQTAVMPAHSWSAPDRTEAKRPAKRWDTPI
jgi:hypothetical protein